jgi:hypothetical protein
MFSAERAAVQAERANAAMALEQPGRLERALGSTADQFDKVRGAFEGIPLPAQYAGMAAIGGIGGAISSEDPLAGFVKGAGAGAAGRLGMKLGGEALLATPRLGQELLKAGRLSGAEMGRFEALEKLGSASPEVQRFVNWSQKAGGGQALDFIEKNANVFVQHNVSMLPMMVAMGVLEDKDAKEFAQMWAEFATYGFIHGQVLGGILGNDPVRIRMDRDAQMRQAQRIMLASSPETRNNLTNLNWDRVVEQSQERVNRTFLELERRAQEDPNSPETASAREDYNFALRLHNENLTAPPEARAMFEDNIKLSLAKASNLINGVLTPNSNMNIELLTREQIIQKMIDANPSYNGPGLPMTEEQAIQKNPGADGAMISKGTDKNGFQIDAAKDTVFINIDNALAKGRLSGEAISNTIAHEVAGHGLFGKKEYREKIAPLYNKLFGTEFLNENGEWVQTSPSEPGLSRNDLYRKFFEKYLEGQRPEEVAAYAEAAGVWDRENGTFNTNKIVELMREEVLAEAHAGRLFSDPESPLQRGIGWVASRVSGKNLKAALNHLYSVAGPAVYKEWVSGLTGATYSPDVMRAIRNVEREMKKYDGDFIDAEKGEAVAAPITPKDVKKSKEMLQKYYGDTGKFETTPVAIVTDSEGNVVQSVKLNDSEAFEGSWNYHQDEATGDNLPNRERGFGELPAELLGIQVPVGGRVQVQRQIAYDEATGKPIERKNKATVEHLKRRVQMLRDAIDNAGDPSQLGRFRAVGGREGDEDLHYTGKMTAEQRAAVAGLPESVVPASIKELLFKYDDLMSRGDGTVLDIDYASRLNDKGNYQAFSPKIRQIVPLQLHLSKAGNFYTTAWDISDLRRKVRLYEKYAKGVFEPWGGDTQKFWNEFRTILLPNLTNADPSVPGWQGLDADPNVAKLKRTIYEKMLGAPNPNVPNVESIPDLPRDKFSRSERKLDKQSSFDQIIKSFRLDSVTAAEENANTDYKYPIPYKARFMPEQKTRPEEQLPELPPVFEESILKGLRSINAFYMGSGAGRRLPLVSPVESFTTRFKPRQNEEDAMVSHGFYSKAGAVLLEKMPNRASAEQLKGILDPQKGSGIKPEELKWSGIDQFIERTTAENGFVTKDDIRKWLKEDYAAKFETRTTMDGNQYISNAPEWGRPVQFETIADAENAAMKEFGMSRTEARDFVWDNNEINALNVIRQTKYSEYTLPGGKNYKETILRLPGVKYKSSHFSDIPNYVAHLRTAEHGNGLLVEELQSDLHQQAREKGYKEPIPVEELLPKMEADLAELTAERTRLSEQFKSGQKELRSMPGAPSELTEAQKERVRVLTEFQGEFGDLMYEVNAAIDGVEEDIEAHKSGKRVQYRGKIADAPFRKDWPLQLFKYALKDAVETGKEWVGWTGGERQADRYSLSNHVDTLAYDTVNQKLTASRGGERIFDKLVPSEQVKNYVGKDIAEQLLSSKDMGNGMRMIFPKDMKLGGEGMKGFYDIMLPKELGKYVKQWGGSVEKFELPVKMFWGVEGNPDIPTDVGWSTPERAAQAIQNSRTLTGKVVESPETAQIWKINITPEMRESVAGGQTRFSPAKEGVPGALEGIQPELREEERLPALASIVSPKGAAERSMETPIDQIQAYDPRTATVSAGDRRRGRAAGEYTPLEGAPIVEGATGPDPRINTIAEQYAKSRGIPVRRQAEYVTTVDSERAKRIADAYAAMPHAPNDPTVREAYADMIRQTRDQYDALTDAGFNFWFMDPENDPYEGKPWRAMRDLRKNQSMAVFPTEAGFGSGETEFNVKDNPLLADTGLMWPYGSPDGPLKRVTANDLFRAVHDAFGHGMEGAGFRAEGEENAWQAHSRLFTGPALGAMTSETRGQNSWLNFGPHGEKNKTASVFDTMFADQKTGLMPEWTWKEGVTRDEVSIEQPKSQAALSGIRFSPAREGLEAGAEERRELPKTIADERGMFSVVIGAKPGEHGYSYRTISELKDQLETVSGQKAAIETWGDLQLKKQRQLELLDKTNAEIQKANKPKKAAELEAKRAKYAEKVAELDAQIETMLSQFPEKMRGMSPEDAAWKSQVKKLNKTFEELDIRATPSPFTASPLGIRSMAELGDSVHDILKSDGFNGILKDFFGIEGLEVRPLSGTWQGQIEPSFDMVHPDLTFDKAKQITQLLTLAFAQDAGITYKPSIDLKEGIQAAYLVHPERLTDEQLKLAFDKAREVGVDISTTTDGKGIKALNFGTEGFADKISEIQKAAAINQVHETIVDSELYETEKIFKGRDSQRVLPNWLNTVAGGQSLLQRSIDSLLVEYAKAAAAQGYIFDPALYAKRYGLSEADAQYVTDKLYPTDPLARSASPLLAGTEILPVKSTYTLAGKRETAVTDMIHALQMRAASDGVIQPGDYSERAKDIISTVVMDEVQQHMARAALNPKSPNAIGWYDAALKRMKGMYSQLFPWLDTKSPKYDADKSLVFDAVLGITSQGNDVFENGKMATRVVLMLEQGDTIPDAVKTLKGTFGNQTAAIENNLLKLHELLTRHTPTQLRNLFFKTDTVSNWNKALKQDQSLYYNGAPLSVDGGSGQKVTGFMVFGPKIGSFINNLHGDYSTLTADLWYTRTWNRILGRSFKHDPLREGQQFDRFKDFLIEEYNRNQAIKKGKEYTERVEYNKKGVAKPFLYGEDAPDVSKKEFQQLLENDAAMLELAESLEKEFRTGGYKVKSDLRRAAKNWVQDRESPLAAPRASLERAFQQSAMEEAQAKLIKAGIDVTIADMQAALWFNEKELFGKYGAAATGAEPADYADAANFILDVIKAGGLFQVERGGKTVRLLPENLEAKLTNVHSPNKNLMKELMQKENARKEAEKARKEAEGEEEGEE